MSPSPTPTDVPLRARVGRGDPLIGLVVKMPCPAVIEAAGHAGIDLVVIDAEHGSGDTADLEHHLRAADSAGIAAIVRVGVNDPLQILRALDAGAIGVVVPHINTVADAQAAARAAHYAPDGHRGLATSTRAGLQSIAALAEHIERARRDTIVIAQIEDHHAVATAAEIAATPHIDAIWVGFSDLSMSLGHPGDTTHPDVAAAINAIVAAVATASRTALCVLVDNEDDAAIWRQRGATIALFGATNLLAARLSDLNRRARTTLNRTPATHETLVSATSPNRDAQWLTTPLPHGPTP